MQHAAFQVLRLWQRHSTRSGPGQVALGIWFLFWGFLFQATAVSSEVPGDYTHSQNAINNAISNNAGSFTSLRSPKASRYSPDGFVLNAASVVNSWSDAAADEQLQIASYFPLEAGNAWTYLVDESNSTQSVLPGTTTINGVVTKALQDEDGFTQFFSNDAAGIRLHRQFLPHADIGLGFPVDLEITFTPPIVLANATTTSGVPVPSNGLAQSNNLPSIGVINLSYSAEFTVQGFESVSVPAGSFNALKLQGTINVGGDLVQQTFHLTRNVGIVKATETFDGITATAELISTNVFPSPVLVDFDGDAKTDLGVYQTSSGNWFGLLSADGFSQHLNFGGPNFLPVPADYDGDGISDTAVYDSTTGNWFIDQSTAGFRIHPNFGGSGFIPVVGDYDGDGRSDLAVCQTTTGHWFFVRSTLGFGQHLAFGGSGFVPVPGDYDGDGRTDSAVYQTSTGNWFIAQSTAGFRVHASFGGAGFIAQPGDYDGDGKMDVGVYQSSTGNWFGVGSTTGFLQHLNFGGSGFMPVAADYDGDGQTDTAVYETSTGHWFVMESGEGFRIQPSFGGSGFIPVLPQVTILRALGIN